MTWLNYHHLHYFWAVARFGGVSAASRELHLGAATISAQLKQLEAAMGQTLFRRRGRGMELTEAGRTAFTYADEIFSLGNEMQEALAGRASLTLRVGVADVMPKVMVHELLRPALDLEQPVRLVCEEGHPEELLASLAVHRLDLVLSDAPIPSHVDVRAFNHVLGECGITLFAAEELVSRHGDDLPGSLDGAPFLLPGRRTALRRTLDQWLDQHGITPHVVGEFDDGALLKVFGQAGQGVFAAPSAVEDTVRHRYDVEELTRMEGCTERFYAITAERRIQHPAVAAIRTDAREHLFA